MDNTLLGHIIVESVAELSEDSPFFKDWMTNDKPRKIEMELIVNGFPTDIKRFFDEFEKQTDRMIAKEARDLIHNGFYNFTEELEKIKRATLRKFKKQFNLPASDEDYY